MTISPEQDMFLFYCHIVQLLFCQLVGHSKSFILAGQMTCHCLYTVLTITRDVLF